MPIIRDPSARYMVVSCIMAELLAYQYARVSKRLQLKYTGHGLPGELRRKLAADGETGRLGVPVNRIRLKIRLPFDKASGRTEI